MSESPVRVFIGDCPAPDGFAVLSEFSETVFFSRPSWGIKGLFVDVDALKLRADKVKWIFKNAKTPTILMTKNKSKLGRLPKGIKVKEGGVWGEDFKLFDCLNLICKERDRHKVLEYLKSETPPPILIYNWLVGSAEELGCSNLLIYLDMNVLNKKGSEWFYEFIAFGIKPTSGYIRFQYRLKKS